MPDEIKSPPPRRKSSRAATMEPDLAKVVASDPVAALMALHQGMVDRMEYQPIGQIVKIQIGRSVGIADDERNKTTWLDFLHQNFHLAQMPDGMKDVVTPWPGLTALIERTDQLCPNCSVECDNCGPSFSVPASDVNTVDHDLLEIATGSGEARVKCKPGERPCSRQCGGTGVYRSGGTLCTHPNMKDGVCPDCRGTNEIPTMSDCPSCAGTGIIKCDECLGTGRMSTGHLAVAGQPGGIKVVRLNSPKCPECEGRGRVIKRNPQNVEITDLGIDSYIGPVLSMMIKPPDRAKEPEIWQASADAGGQFMHLVSQHKFQPGTRVLILGGTLTKNP